MAKAYWISTYQSVRDPDKLAAYAKLATAAIDKAGARVVARGQALKAYEHGLLERSVILEFDSVEAAVAMHDGPEYQAALAALGDGAVRDLRIVPGV